MPLRSATEFVVENWSRLSPANRAAYNKLQQAHGLPPIPEPAEDFYVTPRRGRSEFQEPNSSPKGPYLKVARLLFGPRGVSSAHAEERCDTCMAHAAASAVRSYTEPVFSLAPKPCKDWRKP